MELIEVIVYSLQIFVVSTLTIIIATYMVSRIKKKKYINDKKIIRNIRRID